jgi:RimJ/RimL family protein N-acetyltransferase
MAQLIIHKKVEDFLNYNEDYLFDDYISHYTFIKTLENRHTTGIEINNAFNVIDDDGSFVAALLSDKTNFNLYASKWNENVIVEISNYSHFNTAPPNIHLTGTKELILELAKVNNFNYEVFKDRTVYDCCQVNEGIESAEGEFDFAVEDDLETISKMSYLWHLEEYRNHAFRTPEFMGDIVEKGIKAQTFFKWTANNEITTVAQVMYSENGYPIIGHFYTNERHRNKGYGKALIITLTQLILSYGHDKCGLISDTTNIASNIVFKKAGYKKIYETLSITTK